MDIAALIRSTQGGRTYERLERDCGGEPTRQRLHQIATGAQKGFPKPATIRGLAHGLHVSQRTVVLAWAESVGLDASTNDTRLVQLLPPSSANLTDDQIAAVLATVRAMTMKESETDGATAATIPARDDLADQIIELDEVADEEPRPGGGDQSRGKPRQPKRPTG